VFFVGVEEGIRLVCRAKMGAAPFESLSLKTSIKFTFYKYCFCLMRKGVMVFIKLENQSKTKMAI